MCPGRRRCRSCRVGAVPLVRYPISGGHGVGCLCGAALAATHARLCGGGRHRRRHCRCHRRCCGVCGGVRAWWRWSAAPPPLPHRRGGAVGCNGHRPRVGCGAAAGQARARTHARGQRGAVLGAQADRRRAAAGEWAVRDQERAGQSQARRPVGSTRRSHNEWPVAAAAASHGGGCGQGGVNAAASHAVLVSFSSFIFRVSVFHSLVRMLCYLFFLFFSSGCLTFLSLLLPSLCGVTACRFRILSFFPSLFFFYGPFFAWVTVQTSRWDSRSRGAPSRLDSRRTSAARRRHFCTTGLRLHTHHPPGRHAAVKAGTGTGPRQRISSTPLPLHGPPPHHRRNPLLPSLASALAVTPATGLRRPGGALPKSTRDSLTSADSASPVPVCLYGTVHTYIHT